MRTWRLLAALTILAVGSSWASSAHDDLRPFVRGSWQRILAAHAGRPTVVHLWGLTCGPCRTEMPEWGKLLAERPDLNLVAIDADLVPNERDAVVNMLAQTALARAENWIFADAFLERLRHEIDLHWRGEIPRTILVGRDGSITTIEGAADLREVRAWLDLQAN